MNNDILSKRWKEVDKLLSTFYSKNEKLNKSMYNRIQSILDSINYEYDDLYKYASINQIKRLRTQIDELKDKYGLEGYTGYLLNNLYKKKKIRNSDLLMGLLTIAYYTQYQEQKVLEETLFDEIISMVYIEAQEEYISLIPPKEKKKKKPRLLTVPEAFLLQLIGMSGFNNIKWYDYKEGSLNYYVKHLFQKIAVKLQQKKELSVYDEDIMKELHKQERTYFAKKNDIEPSRDYVDVYYGSLDNQVCYLVNQSYLAGIKRQGCKKVRFIAVIDKKTTDMCRSLDNQIFSINDWNTFSRYSQDDGRNIIYRVKGLQVGANLPPIDNGYHHCRSTIYPER